jgi:hypothetical protein
MDFCFSSLASGRVSDPPRKEIIMALQIKPAYKYKQFAKVCFWGVEKSGKTHAALALATLLAGDDGKVGVISSEYASSKFLAHRFPHDIIDLAEVDENGNIAKNAFSAQRYEEAIRAFTNEKYSVIVIDSLSHLWEGEGGILDAVNSRKGNAFNDGWGENSPVYRRIIQTILSARCHVIMTLRAKDNYVQQEYTKRDGSKGTQPVNVGLAPIMRKQFGYEVHLKIRMDSMIGVVEATAMQDYIRKGEELEAIDDDFVGRLLNALDGVLLPEPTEQQKEMRALLDEFYSLAPLTYANITNWEQQALRAALSIPKGTSLPDDYTDADVAKMRAYVDSKKQRTTRKTVEPGTSPATQTEEKPVVANAPAPVASEKPVEEHQTNEQEPATQAEKPKLTVVGKQPTTQEPAISEQQLRSIRKLSEYLNKPEPDQITTLTSNEASQIIQQLTSKYKEVRAASAK